MSVCKSFKMCFHKINHVHDVGKMCVAAMGLSDWGLEGVMRQLSHSI
jgi:hypothetical protein